MVNRYKSWKSSVYVKAKVQLFHLNKRSKVDGELTINKENTLLCWLRVRQLVDSRCLAYLVGRKEEPCKDDQSWIDFSKKWIDLKWLRCTWRIENGHILNNYVSWKKTILMNMALVGGHVCQYFNNDRIWASCISDTATGAVPYTIVSLELVMVSYVNILKNKFESL